MKKSTRSVLLVLLGLVVFGFLGAAVVTALMVHAIDGFGGSTEWSADAVAERELPSTFGVRLPVKPLRYLSRSTGFQDQQFEVLVQLPAGAADTFLQVNHLARGEKVTIDADLADQLRALDPSMPALKACALELPPALQADGGVFELHRSGELLEGEGVVWVHLVAFET